jgi:hypothetical protein
MFGTREVQVSRSVVTSKAVRHPAYLQYWDQAQFVTGRNAVKKIGVALPRDAFDGTDALTRNLHCLFLAR